MTLHNIDLSEITAESLQLWFYIKNNKLLKSIEDALSFKPTPVCSVQVN